MAENREVEPTGLGMEAEIELAGSGPGWVQRRDRDSLRQVRLSWGVIAALAGVLVAGAYFRFIGVNWDSNTHLHPDERFITMVETSISWPRSLAEYFDTARSPLNPYNRGYNSFVYGTFPLFFVKWLGDLLGRAGYDEIHLVGRVVSGLFDLGSVILIFLIGRRLYGVRTGLLASLLTAAAVIQIQQSHFFTFDTFVGFFLLASFLLALRIWQGERWYDYPLLGASLGLATASKINSVLFVIVVALVALKRFRDAARADSHGAAEWPAIAGRFALSGLVALLVFRVVEPYAFTGPGFLNVLPSTKFVSDMLYVQKLVSGEIDQPPSVQWAGTTPYLFPLRNLVMWGMGLPLGAVGWVGLLFAGYELFRKQEGKHLLIVAWTAFFFWYQGGQMAKTMRYFLPIVPLLALLGSYLLTQIDGGLRSGALGARWWRSTRLRRWSTHCGLALLAVVAGGTLLYAYAFTRIYSRPVTRIAATEWIFANIPQGTAIANEHWDDPLPLRWKGRDAGWYRGTTLELYADDTPEKLMKLADQLDQTQYIFLSSNRLYGSIPKMPARYPMTTEYYRLLFSGELGFKLVKSFTSYPTLFGIEFNDDSAEEIFSVYDHPKVLIFEKTASYSGEKVRQLLGAVPLDRVLPLKSAQADRNGLLLTDEERAAQEQGGTWSTLYDRNGLTNRFPTVSWWLALQLFGLLAVPLTWRLFGRFPDRGYGLAKILGLLVVGYLAWLLPSLRLLPFGRQAIAIGIAALAAVSLLVVRGRRADLSGFLRSHSRLIVVHELLFLSAFALFWLIRVRNPDLWHIAFGGEKPMEFAYLNAVAKSTYFPPYDPWMAGGYINYYYFGFVLVAVLMRLTGVVPYVAFNLAIPSIFALTAAGLFSFGFNCATMLRRESARRLPAFGLLCGLATTVFVLIAGNLDGLVQILEALWRLSGLQIRSTIPFLEGAVKAIAGAWAVVLGGKALPAFDFWRSTRVIGPENPTPITEFPYFTFLYGDLHPHMISMPLAALALSLTLAIVWHGAKAATSRRQIDAGISDPHALPSAYDAPPVALVGIGGLVIGALQATNSWDYPTYLLLLSAAFVLSGFARHRAITVKVIADAFLATIATYLAAQLLFLPFNRAYELFYNGVDPSPGKTSVQHFVLIMGFFMFCIGSTLVIDVSQNRWHRFWLRGLWERLVGSERSVRRRELAALLVRPSPWVELLPYLALALLGVSLAALLLRLFLVGLLLLMILLALFSLFDRDAPPEKLLLVLFVGLGLALALAVEFVAIKGDIGRMNTVFKFYLQAWFLFGIASALGVTRIIWTWRAGRPGWFSGWRRAWLLTLVVLFASVLIYPFASTPVKVGTRFNPTPPTLDGMAYMQQTVFKDQNRDIVLARDYAAIRWLQDRVIGSPVVLEAQIPEYRWGSRVSIYTGLPTVLGWTWHQRQQRAGYQWMIDERLRDIKTMFESTDLSLVSALLRKYDVSLIYVGDLERAYYPASGLTKFEQMVGRGLSVVYNADGVTIYEVNRDGRGSVVDSR